MDVSIVVINYNSSNLTRQCLSSIFLNTYGLEYEVILVDNASTETDFVELTYEFPKAILIRNEKNVGFAGGNNTGIKYAKGKYILLLNNDTYLINNAILTVYTYMEKHPEAGVASARLVFPNGTVQSAAQRFPSVKYSLIELLRFQKFMPKKKAGKLLLGAFFDHEENVIADWVWGTFFFFRSEILKQMPNQQLDETYFMYCEDMQWCRDIKSLGYEIHYCADAVVVHLMGGSSGDKVKLMAQNGKHFLKRNYGVLNRFLIKVISKIL